jgi:hypothetical protein
MQVDADPVTYGKFLFEASSVSGTIRSFSVLIARRYHGRFFGRRVNCERVPQLPATLIRWVLDDPWKIPYLLVWKNSDDVIQEAVRIARHSEAENPYVRDWRDWVEVKRTNGTRLFVRGIRQPLLSRRFLKLYTKLSWLLEVGRTD